MYMYVSTSKQTPPTSSDIMYMYGTTCLYNTHPPTPTHTQREREVHMPILLPGVILGRKKRGGRGEGRKVVKQTSHSLHNCHFHSLLIVLRTSMERTIDPPAGSSDSDTISGSSAPYVHIPHVHTQKQYTHNNQNNWLSTNELYFTTSTQHRVDKQLHLYIYKQLHLYV